MSAFDPDTEAFLAKLRGEKPTRSPAHEALIEKRRKGQKQWHERLTDDERAELKRKREEGQRRYQEGKRRLAEREAKRSP